MIVTKNKIEGLCSKRNEHLIIKNTPAVTNVAAWIRADTGVGPSIASGSQICKPICADLPIAPKKSKKVITDKRSNSNDKKEKLDPIAQGDNANTTL